MKKSSFLGAIVQLLLLAMVFVAFGASVPIALGGTAAVAFVSSVAMNALPSGLAFTGLDVTGLTGTLGSYFRANRDVLIRDMLLNQAWETDMTVYDDIADELPLPNLATNEIVKPGLDKTSWAPTSNAVEFGARVLKVRDAKFDLVLYPTALHKTWLGKYKKKGSDNFDMPFEQEVFNQIIGQVKEDVHLKALYGGVYNAAGTTTAATVNGFNKIVADEITATNITPVTTGVITGTNVLDALEAVYDGLHEAAKAVPTVMNVSPQIFDWAVRRRRALYGANTDYNGMAMNQFVLDGTMCTVKREAGLAGSQRIHCFIPGNYSYGLDSESDMTNIQFEKEKRSLLVMGDFKMGFQIANISNRALSVNDQA